MSASGGGNGTPISIFFQIVGIDQIKAALASLPGEFAKIDAAAQAAGVNLSALTTNFQAVGNSAASGLAPASEGLQQLGQNETVAAEGTEKLSQSMQQQSASAEAAGSALSATGESANVLSTGMEKVGQTFTQAAEGTDVLTQSQTGVQGSIQGTGEAVATVSSGMENYATVQGTVAEGGSTVAQAQEQIKTSLDSTGQSISTASTEFEKLTTVQEQQSTTGEAIVQSNQEIATSSASVAQAQQEEVSVAGEVSTGMKEISTTSSATVASTDKLGTSFTQTTTALGKGTGAMKATSTETKSMKEAFEGAAAPITALIGSSVSLFMSFEQLEKAQTKVDLSEKRVISTHQAVEKAQLALNAALVKFGEGSAEVVTAQENLAKANLAAGAADDKNKFAQDALSETYLNFAQQVIPNVLAVVGSLGSVYQSFSGTLRSSITTFKQHAATVAAAAIEEGTMAASTKILGVEVSATSKVMALAGLTNPFFIALTIGGALVAAFVSNLGGFRDAINGIGVALGNAIPGLRGILDMIGGFGDFMVKSLGGTVDAEKKFSTDTGEAMDTAGKSVAALQESAGSSIEGFQKYLKAATAEIAALRVEAAKPIVMAAPTTGGGGITGPTQDKAPKPRTQEELTKGGIADVWAGYIKGVTAAVDANGKFVTTTDEINKALAANKAPQEAMSILSVQAANHLTILNDAGQALSTGNYGLAESHNKLGIAMDGTIQDLQDLTPATVAGAVAQSGSAKASAEAAAAQKQAALQAQTNTTVTTLLKDATDKGTASTLAAAVAAGAAALSYGMSASVAQRGIPAWKAFVEIKDEEKKKDEDLAIAGEKLVQQYGFQASALQENGKWSEQAIKLGLQQVATSKAYDEALQATVINLEKSRTATEGYRGTTDGLNKQLAEGSIQVAKFNEGFAAQEMAFAQAKVALSELQGTVAATMKEYASGEAGLLAFRTAMENQRLTMLGDAVETQSLLGKLVELRAEYAGGLPSLTAFNKAFTEQEIKATENKIALAALQGTLLALRDEYNNQAAGSTAFLKGFTDAQIAIENTKLKLSELQGSIASTTISMHSGEAQTLAYNEGLLNEQKAVQDLTLNVEKAKGTFDAMAAAQKDGSLAVATWDLAIVKTNTDVLEMKTSNVALAASTTQLFAIMKEGANTADLMTKGFLEGGKAVIDWANGITTAKGALVGTQAALIQFANVTGTQLPAGLKLSTEGLKQWLGILNEAPDVIKSVVDKVDQAAQGIFQSLGDAAKKGGKDLKAEYKKLGEDLGFGVTNAMKEAMKPQIIADSIKPGLEKGFALLSQVGVGSQAGKDIAAGMIGEISSAVEKSPQLKTIGDQLIKAIQQGPKSGQSYQGWLAEVDGLLAQFGKTTAGVTQTSEQLNSQINAGASAYSALAAKLHLTTDATMAYVAALKAKALAQMADVVAGVPTVAQDKNALATQPKSTGAVDTSGLDAATGKINTFKALVTTIPAAVSSAVSAANTSFSTLNANNPAFVASMTTVTGLLQQFGPAVGQAVSNANVYFGGLNALQPAFLASLTSVATTMQMLGPAVNQAVINANTYFGALNALQPPFLASLTSVTTTLQMLGPAVNQAVINANTYFAALNALQPAFTVTLNTLTQSFIQIGPAVNTAIIAANTYFAALNAASPTFAASIVTVQGLLNMIPPAVNQAVIASNIFFGQLGMNLPPVLATIETTAAQSFNNVTISASSSAQAIPPFFNTMEVAVQGTFNKLQTDAGNAFTGITNIAGIEAPKISPPYSTAAGTINTALGTIATAATKAFGTVTTESGKSADNVKTQLTSSICHRSFSGQFHEF